MILPDMINYRSRETAVQLSPFITRKLHEYALRAIDCSLLESATAEILTLISNIIGEKLLFKVLEISKGPAEFFHYADIEKRIGQKELIIRIQKRIVPFLEGKRARFKRTTSTDRRFAEIKRVFRLNAVEIELLQFLFVLHSGTKFDDVLTSVLGGRDLNRMAVLTMTVHQIFGCRDDEVRRSIKNSNIFQCDLVKQEFGHFNLADWLSEYLWGITDCNLPEHFLQKYSGEALLLEDHFLDEQEKHALLHLIKNTASGHILFYGEAGTGKTSLTRSLAKVCGKELFVINRQKNDSVEELKTAIIAASNLVDAKSGVILVDETDSLLNSRRSQFFFGEKSSKSWLNAFLDESKHKIIWITNEASNIEPSTLRRFDFCKKFEPFNTQKKLRVFRYVLQKNGIEEAFTEDELLEICKRYPINAGVITDAIANFKAIKNNNHKDMRQTLELVLRNYQLALTGKRQSYFHSKSTSSYFLDVLNTSEDLSSVISIARRFIQERDQQRRGLTLLFFGSPGAGKTEFAKYLASALCKEVIVKRASDLISCWHGETEKAIARAFDEASASEAVVLLDEADSFLYPRSKALHSWEVTHTNELLTQMEAFTGILICTTNFLEGLDEAALRRFKLKIEFRPLTASGKLQLYNKMFSQFFAAPLDADTEGRIVAIENLTPGDYQVVTDRFTLSSEKIGHEELIEALKNESKLKSKRRPIGFGSSCSYEQRC